MIRDLLIAAISSGWVAGLLSWRVLGLRLLNAPGTGRSVRIISMVNLIANVAGNDLLVPPEGVVGIAASTGLVYRLACAQIPIVTTRNLRHREGNPR